MQKQLQELDLDFNFLEAVDGATLTDDYLAQICDFTELAKKPYHMHKGVYGCLLSHYNAYERIIAENLPYALVLEDDIIINSDLKSLLPDLAATIKPDEVILLFSQNGYMPTELSKQHSKSLLRGSYQLSYPLDPHAFGSAAGCVVSNGAARRMLDFLLPIRYTADAWGEFYDNKAVLSLRCVTPFPIEPAGLKSDIDYVSAAILLGTITKIVDRYNIFPFKQILKYRRRKLLKATVQYSFSTKPSPVLVDTTTLDS